MIIGIAGDRYSGKFTLSKILQNLGFGDTNFSILDEPKLDLQPFLNFRAGISPFSSDIQSRLLIDDFIYSYKHLIEKINKNYWLNKLDDKIKDSDGVIIIRDINSLEEFNWSKSKNIVTIYVTRYNKDGTLFNKDLMNENFNWDYRLNWTTSNDIEFLTDIVKAQLHEFLTKYGKL